MTLRRADYDDYESIVEMYIDLIKTVYPERKLAPKMFFYAQVYRWYEEKLHLRVVEKDNEIIAFSLCTFDNVNGVTETFYHADIAYVKPEYQKSRAAYLMYMDICQWAVENDYGLQTAAIPETGADKIISKRFNSKLRFQTFAQKPDLIDKYLKENNMSAPQRVIFK